MKSVHSLYIFIQLVAPVWLKPSVLRLRATDSKQSCDSLVYCQGSLLDTIQRARLYRDSKTFVDFSQRNSENITLENFNQLMAATDNSPSKEQLLKFIEENFEDNNELIDWTPDDFTSNPQFIERIKDKDIKQFAKDLVGIWPSLGRKINPSVFQEPRKHSIIGVPNGIIIPGGRFKEFYYWDSYWIVEGLLLSEMTDTARGIIENLLSMVERYGFVPNGGRVYYLNRSQPPLLTLMAGLYYDQTADIKWIRKYINLLDKELTYWLEKKTIQFQKDGKTYEMAHYISESTTPRPESYYEDVNTCAYFHRESEKDHCYQGLKSGAESGWDFSSRWFFDQDGGVNTNLTHIDAQRVVPVDLNAFLYGGFARIASFYKILGNKQNAEKWTRRALDTLQSIEEVLYDEKDGIWYDFDLELSKSRKMFFPSNFVPLWTNAYDRSLREKYGRKAAEYFTELKIGEFKGGIPCSLDDNNEQWDLPNAWPPPQEFVILGLWNTGNKKAKQIARQAANRWVYSNYRGYKEQNTMFEKYDATKVGQYGGGGEYEVQKGFGWTNGLALKLIDKFYTRKNGEHTDDIRKKNNRS